MPGETLLPNQTAPDAMLHEAIARAGAALARRQHADGHWLFELEADATIPAEYVLLEHFLDRIDPALEAKIGVYLRSIQGAHGGWPLFHDGAFNLSASVKAYFALKAIGDDPDAPHMARARQAILDGGWGGADQRVHPRAARAVRPGAVARGAGDAAGDHAPAAVVPVPSVEGVVLVAHGDRAAAGADGVAAGGAQSSRCRDPGAVPHAARHRCATGSVARIGRVWGRFFKGIDSVLRVVQPAFPRRGRQQRNREGGALRHRTAERRRWVGRHLSGDRQQRDDVRHAGLSARASGLPRSRGARCASCWWWKTIAPTASRACRRSGIPASRDTRWRRPVPTPTPPVPGCASGRSWMWSATGRCAGPGCDRAGGRSSTPIRTTRMSTTPRWSACCCIATAILPTPRRSSGHANGSSACSRPTAAGARSSRRTRISI